MRITKKQAYVLEHLGRVEPLDYKVEVRAPAARYKLDGWECTSQIIGLVVKKLVREAHGELERAPGSVALSIAREPSRHY